MKVSVALNKIQQMDPTGVLLARTQDGRWQFVTDLVFGCVPGREIFLPTTLFVEGVEYTTSRDATQNRRAVVANINEAFPSNYLKASDIRGVMPIVTIDHVAFEPVGRQREMKAVVYFKGKQKGIILNKTNATKITEIAGSQETDDWDGTRIMLFATETEFSGETVECIRVKAVPANSNGVTEQARHWHPPAPEPVFEMVEGDDVPFMWIVPFVLPALLALHTVLA
jgi:hypothetical protein